ncbi:hypothetical protein SAMN02745912_01629 [Paramaledivibacter caminithermalis DSM 15212]|uniref:DUF5666 domain-containing protein n=2 Tax=Paramaledivibacter TaxID=1884934 RepID=A0A1M6NAR0_PARC5|nr:hypothetical protein SAMN02745912_01629 [Paramaledivibacter caminithermalis DSM 15212]
MMNEKYKNAISTIQASDKFKKETLQKLNKIKGKRRYKVEMTKKILIGFAASLVLVIGIMSLNMYQSSNNADLAKIDLTERIVVDPNAPSGDAVVNIEGIIVEVSDDGLSFKLDNGKWVKITDETIIGISGPTAAPKEEQFFEPTFRVGNSIAGFTLDENANEIIAYAIYTNWNWEDPIRK